MVIPYFSPPCSIDADSWYLIYLGRKSAISSIVKHSTSWIKRNTAIFTDVQHYTIKLYTHDEVKNAYFKHIFNPYYPNYLTRRNIIYSKTSIVRILKKTVNYMNQK